MIPLRKVFTIQLDRERQFCMNNLAAWRFEERAGKPLFAALAPMLRLLGDAQSLFNDAGELNWAAATGALSALSMRDLSIALWAGLGAPDPEKEWRWLPDEDLTPEDVAGMFTVLDLPQIFGMASPALGDALPREEDVADNPPTGQPEKRQNPPTG